MLSLFKPKNKTATILVVDDEPDLVNTIKTRLEWSKFNVQTASDGSEALELMESSKPDLVLLDGNMPVMSGFEMLDLMGQNHKLKNIPVIILTTVCDANKITIAGSLGITEYVTKPFDFTQLLEKIARVLDKK